MGTVINKKKQEVVVDLYAGIGYYTIPFLIHGNAKSVYACEWNPNSVIALKRNLSKAGIHVIEGDPHRQEPENAVDVSSKIPFCKTFEGDNSVSARFGGCLQYLADRVSLGLIPSSMSGWKLGVNVLKRHGGVIHVHENVMDTDFDKWVKDTCKAFEDLFEEKRQWYDEFVKHDDSDRPQGKMEVRCLHLEKVKSYAPHLYHVVADLECRLSIEKSLK